MAVTDTLFPASGVAVGLISTFRLIGGAIATAIYTSIQSSRYTSILPGRVASAAQMTGFTGSVSALVKAAGANTAKAYAAVPGITNSTIAAVQLSVKKANSDAYKIVYLVAVAFGVVAIAASISVKGIEEKQRSNELAARLEDDPPRKVMVAH